jgi:hypothetical protein
MRTLHKILTELFGLFVDDGSFALFILGWLLVAGLVLARVPLPGTGRSVLFAAGLAVILAGSALRAAGRGQK